MGSSWMAIRELKKGLFASGASPPSLINFIKKFQVHSKIEDKA